LLSLQPILYIIYVACQVIGLCFKVIGKR